MNVPLLIRARGTKLHITVNKRLEIVNLPFKPYLVMEKENKYLRSTPIVKTRIPDGIETTMYKVESNSVDEMEEKAKQLSAEGAMFHKIPYIEQVYSDIPDFASRHSNSQPLTTMYLDIEVLTKGDGIFPRATTSPIIAIGCAIGEGEVMIFDQYNKKLGTPDKNILEAFLKYYEEQNPDVLVTYNGTDFDLPYIVERMERCKIDSTRLNRHTGGIMHRNEIRIRGRVHFDCIIPARKDQSLFGIKSRGLKNVSKWYGYEAEEFGEDIGNTQKYIGSDRMKTYLISDIKATRAVGNVYLPNAITLAEVMQVPLGAIVGCMPSFIPKLICARNCNRNNLVPLDNNVQRYGDTEE